MRKMLLAAALIVAACQSFRAAFLYSPKDVADETERLDNFFEEAFLTRLDRSPMLRTRLGIDDRNHLWDDLSEEHAHESVEIVGRDLERLREDFVFDKLTPEARLSHRLFESECELQIEAFRWRDHDYPVNQMRGWHALVPAFLIHYHRVEDVRGAEDYVARLRGIRALFDQLIVGLELREDLGVVPPRFVFPKVIADCRNLLRGAPFDDSARDSPLLADFRAKVDDLAARALIAEAQREALLARAREALVDDVRPAYDKLLLTLERQMSGATTDDGVWKLPDGEAYYAWALRRYTTTRIGVEEVHEYGRSEVARIQREMRELLTQLDAPRGLREFFELVRTERRFYYPDDEEGRADYLARATEILDAMRGRLDELFVTQPQAPLVVKAVEPYRAESAGKAFYERGTPDGSLPGTYYANLSAMRSMPLYQMEALAYHEGLPGHHMQVSIAQERAGLPRFRRYADYPAYVEGWALYAEWIPKELGFYEDPYSDFGRLAMELWRACRLVVDTGVHAKRWTREEAIRYLTSNTPGPEADCVKAVERTIVMPGEATAYKIGMQRIQRLRGRAETVLGAKFDLRRFHDAVLAAGPMPLARLEQVVDDWIAAGG